MTNIGFYNMEVEKEKELVRKIIHHLKMLFKALWFVLKFFISLIYVLFVYLLLILNKGITTLRKIREEKEKKQSKDKNNNPKNKLDNFWN